MAVAKNVKPTTGIKLPKLKKNERKMKKGAAGIKRRP